MVVAAGIVTDVNALLKNALLPMVVAAGIVTDVNALPSKAFSPMVVIEFGIVTDVKARLWNA